jgi:hypothetical protein
MQPLPTPNTKCCDCADCGQELIGISNGPELLDLARLMNVEVVAGRIVDGERDAPYCSRCLVKHQPKPHWAVA